MTQVKNSGQEILKYAKSSNSECQFMEAISSCQQAFVAFLAAKDYDGAVLSLAEEVNTWLYLHTFEKENWFARRAFSLAEMMRGMALEYDTSAQATSFASLYSGKVASALGIYNQSMDWFSAGLLDFQGQVFERSYWDLCYAEATVNFKHQKGRTISEVDKGCFLLSLKNMQQNVDTVPLSLRQELLTSAYIKTANFYLQFDRPKCDEYLLRALCVCGQPGVAIVVRQEFEMFKMKVGS